jgi:hypothetical protein
MPTIGEFYWRSANKVLVGSGGRGLWEISLDVVAKPPSLSLVCPDCSFLSVLPGRLAASLMLQEASDPVTSWNASLLIMDGRVEGVQKVAKGLPRITVSPGSSWVWFTDPQTPLPAEVVESHSPYKGFKGLPKAKQLENQGEIILGFTFLNSTMLQVIHGKTEAQIPTAPVVQLPPPPKETTLGLKGLPYVTVSSSTSFGSTVIRGAPLFVGGQNFSPNGGNISIYVDADLQPVVKPFPPGQKGDFLISFAADFSQGLHRLVVSQSLGQEQFGIVDGFAVVHGDLGDEEQPKK